MIDLMNCLGMNSLYFELKMLSLVEKCLTGLSGK